MNVETHIAGLQLFAASNSTAVLHCAREYAIHLLQMDKAIFGKGVWDPTNSIAGFRYSDDLRDTKHLGMTDCIKHFPTDITTPWIFRNLLGR